MRHTGDAPVYVISVAARLSGLPPWMLRLLDQEGLVVPTRTDKNRRLYSDNDIARLERIRHLTEERGVNLAGVKVILEMEEMG
jgi:MerR family transcriptional regulator, heat shock protein HspR